MAPRRRDVRSEAGPRPVPAVTRLVVKIGTTSLTDDLGRPAPRKVSKAVREVAETASSGLECVLVSSGAIARGVASLGLPARPRSISKQQAAAAVGQGKLMSDYLRLFRRRGIVAAHDHVARRDCGA